MSKVSCSTNYMYSRETYCHSMKSILKKKKSLNNIIIILLILTSAFLSKLIESDLSWESTSY